MRSSRRDDNDDKAQSGMNIEFEQLSVTGHVVFAGRDGSVSVNTGGNVDQQTTQTITVGGIETTPEALEHLLAKIDEVNQVIEADDLDEETKEAAAHDLAVIEKQLTSSKKPNAKILVTAARTLYRISPVLASAVFALFGEPLASQIVVGVGGIAVQFFETLMKRHNAK